MIVGSSKSCVYYNYLQRLIVFTEKGLYCPAGDFYVDPWRPVEHAVVTHAHSDHAYPHMKQYYATPISAAVMRVRLGADIAVTERAYGETFYINGVQVSLHPAGHVVGSAQVRIQVGNRVWVATGDYKLENDGLCEPYEQLQAEGFITEATFGLPIYRWKPQIEVQQDIVSWWKHNQAAGKVSLLYGYSFGKAQRLLSMLNSFGPIYGHGAVVSITRALREVGVDLPPLERPPLSKDPADLAPGALILAPPSVGNTSWVQRFGDYNEAFVSGWMSIRSTHSSRNIGQGFTLSDHADWPALLQAISASGATFVQPFCGSQHQLSRYLREELHVDAPDAPARYEAAVSTEDEL